MFKKVPRMDYVLIESSCLDELKCLYRNTHGTGTKRTCLREDFVLMKASSEIYKITMYVGPNILKELNCVLIITIASAYTIKAESLK